MCVQAFNNVWVHVSVQNSSLFDGYFVVTPFGCMGGKVVHGNSLTLDFITQGTDKRRKAEWFFSLFLSHLTLPSSLPARFLSLTLESCGEEVKGAEVRRECCNRFEFSLMNHIRVMTWG